MCAMWKLLPIKFYSNYFDQGPVLWQTLFKVLMLQVLPSAHLQAIGKDTEELVIMWGDQSHGRDMPDNHVGKDRAVISA